MAGTLRFFADSRIPLAHAVIALVEHARGSEDNFEFGPLDLAVMTESGLTVAGPDLDGVAMLLSRIPGLVELPQPD
jgi:hypothetical protein